ncbi:MAG: GNAT family N-acetyltransferase [Bacteroides sp.]|nr:GNAT family N-acetyltransferase [Bacteroides sp.]
MTDNDITIRCLAGIEPAVIHKAFLEAFSDYAITLDEQSLAAMLKRRGARFDLSFGALNGDGRLVSFIINGIDSHNGHTSAYDTGTGTVREYRGMGLTDRIFSFQTDHLVSAGVDTYVLEVLTDNTPAVKIYTRQGFERVRKLDCFTADNSHVIDSVSDRAAAAVVTVGETTVDEIAQLGHFMDFTPSWQNTLASVGRNQGAFLCMAAYSPDGREVGFGVSETAYGDITLLAVDPAHRRRGIGSRLLAELTSANHIDRAKALNIDSTCTPMRLFLEASGFDLACHQYEMTKKLI